MLPTRCRYPNHPTKRGTVNISIEVENLPEGALLVDKIVLLKFITADGDVIFREQFGQSLNGMERLGMTSSAADTSRAMMTLIPDTGDDYE